MSTILNSLKKSSDQRNQEQDSSLDNFSFGSSGGSSKMRYLLLLIFLILFAVASYYFLNQYLNDEDSLSADDSEQLVADNSRSKPDQKNNKLNRPDAGKVKTELKKAKTESDNGQDAEQGPVVSLNERIAQRQKQLEQRQNQQNQGPVKKDPVNSIKEKPDVIKTSRNEIQKSFRDTDAQDTLDEIKEQPLSEEEIIAQQYRLVHQLPFSIRKELPKFQLNVHIYDEDPEKRVAIINGVRFYINDMIEQTVLIKDIVQYGVLLEVEGQEFLIPR